MRKIIRGGRAIISDDDGNGVTGVRKRRGGIFEVRAPGGMLLYWGRNKHKAARQILIHQQRNGRIKRNKRLKDVE